MLFCSNEILNIKQPRSDACINQSDCYRYLGIWLYPHLTFQSHVDKVCSKVKSGIGLLWRMRNFINQSLAMDLYCSLIEPHFTYADTVYDGCSVASKGKLQTNQNKALGAVMNVDQFYSLKVLHDKLCRDWLAVQRAQHCCNLAYRLLTTLIPSLPQLYSLSNVVMADEKLPLFHQYLRYRYKWGTIVFSILGAIL